MSNVAENFAAAPGKRLFLSFHHDNDRHFYEAFRQLFCSRYEIIEDSSVERTTGSDDGEYIVGNLRAKFITNTDHTIVLCGQWTPWRKFVDWEIKATLDESHGLTGINLPTNPPGAYGLSIVPSRLFDNVRSGYSALLQWQQVRHDPDSLDQYLHRPMASLDHLIINRRPLLRKGG